MIKNLLSLTLLVVLSSSCGIKVPQNDYKFITEPSVGDPILLNDSSRSKESLQSLSGSNVIVNNSIFKGLSDCTKENVLVDTVRKSGIFVWTSKRGKRSQKIITPAIPYSYENCDEYAEEGTYEHAASTVMNYLKKTEELISKETRLILPKVKVRIAPLINFKTQKVVGKIVTRKNKYLVNNAFFIPGNRELIFLPQGRDSYGRVPFSGVPLWNIPFVVSHEYGHHIFNEILGSKVSKKVHVCFKSTADAVKSTKKQATNDKLISSLNEAFADLIGQLVSGDTFSFSQINCFAKTRDLNSPTFYDGTRKILNGLFLDNFLNPKSRNIYSCNQTQFSQIHHFGANIAFGLYQTMKRSNLLSLNLVIDWAKDFATSLSESKSVEHNLKSVINSFAEIAIENKVEEKANICESLKKYFPIYEFTDSCK